MVKTNKQNLSIWMWSLFLTCFSLSVSSVFAIDNPDSPDLIGEFETREQAFLKKINNPHNSPRDYLIVYDSYQYFLNGELNKAYHLIKSKLSIEQQQELLHSQRNWIKFRNAEFKFIKNNWTRQNFGRSSGISRGSYRCTVIKNRVLQLLYYAKNY